MKNLKQMIKMNLKELQKKIINSITEDEIKRIGFLSGIEIHQQLEGKKLHSNKKTIITDEKETKEDLKIYRRMHITKSELNITDKAAEDEIKKNKIIEYYIYKNSDSLVEIDEEPPKNVDEKALNTTLQLVELTKAKTIDYLIPMRKIVVDGSNTTGFQRTMLIAKKGELDYKIEGKTKKIGIDTITLEEDSAKKIREETKEITIIEEKQKNKNKKISQTIIKYNLSRLGIPLIEITTKPCFKTPKELKEGALKIGRTLRLLEVKRGIGTIRQDVNISIKKGARIEIKGVQNIKEIEEIAKNEIIRQKNLLLIQEYIKKNKIKIEYKEKDIEKKITDITEIIKNSNSKIIKEAIKKNKKILLIKLPGWKGLLGTTISKNKRLGTEISDYIKIHTKAKGLFHKDELPNYGITEKEKKMIEKESRIEEKDNYIIIVEEKEEAEKAIKKAIERIKKIQEKIPTEVRKTNQDNSTSYMREMPGENRMYPETDLEIINLKEYKKTHRIKKVLTEEEQKKEYNKKGLNEELIRQIINSYEKTIYDELIKKYEGKEKLIAKIIYQYKKESEKKIKEKNKQTHNFDLEETKKIVETIIKYNIEENKIVEFITKEYKKIVEDKITEETTKKYKTTKLDEKTKKQIKETIKEEKNKNTPTGKIIHLLITKYNIDGKTANKLIQETK